MNVQKTKTARIELIRMDPMMKRLSCVFTDKVNLLANFFME